MRLSRFTTRRLMVLVAMAAVCMGLTVTLQRRQRYLVLAEQYAAKEKFCRAYQSLSPLSKGFVVTDTNRSGEIISVTRVAELERYAHLRKKYERAARYPWLSVPPDPPAPK
jgi:hypothetical protein